MLASDRFAAEVREDELTARKLGISGVPMFVVDRQLGSSGAQPPELLLQMLRQGWENRVSVSAAESGGVEAAEVVASARAP